MIFTTITKDLQKELKSNLPQIMVLLKKQPAIAYKKIGELGQEVGKKYNIELLVNFPHKGKIENFDMYGKQDLSFIVDMEKTRFPIERSIIKEKAKEIFGDVEIEDAYMYEGKEGVKVFLGPANESGRKDCLLYTSPSPRDATLSRMPSSA